MVDDAKDDDAAVVVVEEAAAAAATTATTTAGPRAFAPSDFCGVPATTAGWLGPGYTHDVVLELQGVAAPGALVHYRVESGAAVDANTNHHHGGALQQRRRGRGDAAGSNRFLLLRTWGTYEDGSHYHWEEPDAKNTTAHLARWARSAPAKEEMVATRAATRR